MGTVPIDVEVACTQIAGSAGGGKLLLALVDAVKYELLRANGNALWSAKSISSWCLETGISPDELRKVLEVMSRKRLVRIEFVSKSQIAIGLMKGTSVRLISLAGTHQNLMRSLEAVSSPIIIDSHPK